MQKFNEYVYEEINIEEVEKEITALIEYFKKAKSAKKQIEIIDKITEIRTRVETSYSICYVRFSLNTKDKYYSDQSDKMDVESPRYEAVVNEFYKALVASPFQKAINKHYGPRLISTANIAIQSFDPKIMDEMVEDNKLKSQYVKLLASAKIKYKGGTYNLSEMGKFTTSADRPTRASASKAYYGWFAKHMEEIDEIYDKMVHLRDKMAKKLGYENYVKLGYLRMGRTDYGPEDVKGYREQVYKSLVPVTKQLFRRQAKRLGIKGMKYYDYNLSFLSGNPKPIGGKDVLVSAASKMYNEMSKETGEFFNFMVESELLDLEARAGKSGGGYCTTFPAYHAPFIFSNFNGTSGDVDVLTHEAGHAFMAYCGKDIKLLECGWPTSEACEIHSMSMELFAYPWMESFFGKDADKYRFSHLEDAMTFIPYGVSIDEFQEFVYENPDITPAERRAKWREIEKKYLPHIKYGNNEFLNNGGRWMRQAHVFEQPFYYIDYTIAQVCAFEFFNMINVDREDAWKRYLALCKLGGSDAFLNLLKNKEVKLVSPFKKGCIKKVVKPLKEYLSTFDDSKM